VKDPLDLAEADVVVLREGTPKLLEKLDDIPTLPAIAMKVNDLLNDPDSSAADVARVMKKDQALTAKVLKTVNSSYYGIPGGVTDIQRAIAYLGFNTMAHIILSLSVFSTLDVKGTNDFSISEFWKHALGVAIASELICKEAEVGKPEEAFTCGLLHDLGKIVLFMIHKPTFIACVQRAKNEGISFLEAEQLIDIRSHTYFGQVIADKWGLPSIISDTIHYHHVDVSELQTVIPSHKPMIHLVGLADEMVKSLGIGDSGDKVEDFSPHEIPDVFLERAGIQKVIVNEVRGMLFREMEKAEGFLKHAA